jgi:hypothetical protein
MKRGVLIAAAAVLLAPGSLRSTNMVPNGNFEQGSGVPAQWHVRLSDYRVRTVTSPEGRRVREYLCGCGRVLGNTRPWAGLTCGGCGGWMGGEESGKWYIHNHRCVSLVPGRRGRGVKFTLPTAVGNNQGVRIYSRLVKVKPGWGYRISFYAKAKRSVARVFVECYRARRVPDGFTADRRLEPTGTKKPIDRCYRRHIPCESPAAWTRFTNVILAPRRYRFEWMAVKLYAYMPGEAWFDDVTVTPLSPTEMDQELKKKRAKTKDSRFGY